MIEKILEFIEDKPKITAFCSGSLLSFAFAPYFFVPLLIVLGVLAYLIKKSETKWDAMKIGWIFAFGFYLFNLYWISVGVSVYIEQFWWALPLALCGLPASLSLYTMLFALIVWYLKDRNFYVINFTAVWIIFEFIRTYVLTGFPWSLIGYSFAFSDSIVQVSSIIGSYGLGIVVVFTFGSFFYLLEKAFYRFLTYCFISLIVWSGIYYYGYQELESIPKNSVNIKLRLVQPSIKQTDKWSIQKFWEHFNVHKELSILNRAEYRPDLIIWPEAAVILQPTYVQVLDALKLVIANTHSTLITGGVTDNLSQINRKRDKLFASIYALKENGDLIFDYHKSHLVPFGEYVPLASLLPVNKLTPGVIPYSPGKPGFIVTLAEYNLKIRPLLCYEVIFPDEVKMSNQKADFILNLTNDAYYGNTSGPHQHFYTSKMRAVENGIPLVRVANNGISGIFDPLGRIIVQSKLNSIIYIDSHLPAKLYHSTIYSTYGNWFVYCYLIGTLLLTFLLRKTKKLG